MTLLLLSLPALADTVTLAPGEDWCGAANAAAPGDEIVLLPGDHPGPCVLSRAGAEGAPIVIRGAEGKALPHIVYEGASSNVIDVKADHLTLRGLALGPTQADIDGVKLKSGSFLTVEGCVFTGLGGIGVSANSADSEGLVLRGNQFLDMQATAIYLGCHDGASSCTAADVTVEGNLVDGVRSPDVGYGFELKRDSWGVVRDNVIHDTQGPGIEIFGSEDPTRTTTVDGNFVVRSVNNGSVEVGGSGVSVTNNVVVGGGDGGIYVYAYFDAVHDVFVAGNTVVGEGAAAVRASADVTGSQLVANAAWQSSGGGEPFPSGIAGLVSEGNVRCGAPEECWVDAEAWDFGPSGALLDAAPPDLPLLVDFCGRGRGSPAEVGALEEGEGPGPLAVALKSGFPCGSGGDTGDPRDTGNDDTGNDDTGSPDSGDTASDADTGDGGKAGGCGCAATGSPAGPLVLVLVGLGLIRRGRRGEE